MSSDHKPESDQQRRRREIDLMDKRIGKSILLPQQGSWPQTQYLLGEDAANAIIAALATGRPLLVRGEPGVGKSQLARAAATILKRQFLVDVVQPDSEYTDLLWRIDHTQRLAEAQLARHEQKAARNVSDVSQFLGPGALWWALNPRGADAQQRNGVSNFRPFSGFDLSAAGENGVTLLIDEVDKADISLTNGLLEVLGNGGFAVPVLGKEVSAEGPPPLVVLTSNNTRELPPALLRRCVVLTLSLGKDEAAYLRRIGATVYPDIDETVRELALTQIMADRRQCRDAPKTGLAEYLDLLNALQTLQVAGDDPQGWITRLGSYFKKHQLSES
ncbi:MAG: AAA family ATPase [Gammaproteobacteria bacterium]